MQTDLDLRPGVFGLHANSSIFLSLITMGKGIYNQFFQGEFQFKYLGFIEIFFLTVSPEFI